MAYQLVVDLAGRHGQPQRYRHGWIPVAGYPLIAKSDLSSGDARRSRAVSADEFQRIAARGAAEYQQLKRASAPTTGLDENWTAITHEAYRVSRASWGGQTIDAHTGKELEGFPDKYALTVRDPGMDTTSVPENSSFEDFQKAMNAAKAKYQKILERKDHYLGVFHDDDKGTIDIDPVYVTDQKSQTETVGAYTRALGGAYHFKSGDGYWPPHVEQES